MVVFTLFLISFIFVETKPLSSVSRDLSIVLDCNATSPVDRRTLNLALIEKRFDGSVDEDFKCFLECLYRKYDWMDADGGFRQDVMRSTLSATDLEDSAIEYLLAACSETESEDKCERAYSFTECFWAETEKLEQAFPDEEDDFY